MAGKKAPNTSLTRGETVSGLVFFAVYYLVMPFALTPLLNGIGKVLGDIGLAGIVVAAVEDAVRGGLGGP